MPKTNMASRDHNYIARLQNAIRQLHHCESKYIESVTVSGTLLFFQKSTVEEVEVAVFEISDNPQAKRAYAWSCRVGNYMRCVVVLEIPPVSSPQTAFDAAVAAQIVNRTLR
jgi:hypothetical protein